MMNLDEIVTVTLKVLSQQEELNSRLQSEDEQESTNHILVRLTQIESTIKDIQSALLKLKGDKEETLGDLPALADLKKTIEKPELLFTSIDVDLPTSAIIKKDSSRVPGGWSQTGKKRGPYKKKEKAFTNSGERKTVVIKKGVTDNMFGTKTTSKYNKAISRALKSVHFTPAQLIAEIKTKHASVSRFTGKELVYQVKKAKWRLDGARRKALGLGIYAAQAAKLNTIIENAK